MSPPAIPPGVAVHAQAHGHDHGRGHEHRHGQGHHHPHHHPHHDPHHHPQTQPHDHAPASALRLPPSLLMAGVGTRLLGVAGLLLLLWAAVAWALGEPA